MSLRALQRRVKRLDTGAKPSPFTVWYGSLDAWVERDVLPGVEGGTLAADDMVTVVAALRRWEADGTWERVA